MTQPTDDLAAQMVREMRSYAILSEEYQTAIARRYMEQAVATVSADAFHDGYHAGKIDAERAGKDGR